MSQVLDPLPTEQMVHMVCCYVNATSKIQIARISNIPNWYFERVVFPGQRLVFEAPPQAQLEIHTGMMATAILSDTIPCESLCVEGHETASIATHGQAREEKQVVGVADKKTQLMSGRLVSAVLSVVD